MLVQKYGGTSVATTDKIFLIAKKLKKRLGNKKAIIVVSAMSGETDFLAGLGKEIDSNFSKREMDQLISVGENKTISLLAIALNKMSVKSVSLTGWQAGVVTDDRFGNAFIEKIKLKKIREKLKENQVVVVAGFQGVDKNNNITTLGKGGSDTTAVALASVFNCPCEIYTDVNGIFSADPKILPKAKKLKEISYGELMEMSSNGAKVMETRSVEIAEKFSVDLRVGKSLGNIKEGTRIMKKTKLEDLVIKNIATQDNIAVLNYELEGQEDVHLLLEELYILSQKLLLVSLVKNNQKKIFSCVIDQELTKKIQKNSKFNNKKLKIQKNLCKITLTGNGLATHTLIPKMIFQKLSEEKILFQNITISEISLSFTVDLECKIKTVKILAGLLGLEEK